MTKKQKLELMWIGKENPPFPSSPRSCVAGRELRRGALTSAIANTRRVRRQQTVEVSPHSARRHCGEQEYREIGGPVWGDLKKPGAPPHTASDENLTHCKQQTTIFAGLLSGGDTAIFRSI